MFRDLVGEVYSLNLPQGLKPDRISGMFGRPEGRPLQS